MDIIHGITRWEIEFVFNSYIIFNLFYNVRCLKVPNKS
jgi:hypothetical protein